MSLRDYVTLGRSGLRVSPLCLGAMTFGPDWGWGSAVEDSKRIIDAYLDAGGNFIDTANIYTKGHSEAIIGDHLGRSPARRDRTVIATKFMGNLYPGDPNGGGAGRKAILAACEESLRRLRTAYIDLYWMHFHDPHTPMDETMRALDDLVRAGKVRHIGFSDTPAWVCTQAQYEAIFRHWTPLIALQIEYSLLERTVEADLIPMARALGLGVTPWSPLKGGILTGKYSRTKRPTEGRGTSEWITGQLNERVYKLVDALQSIAGQTHGTPARVALAWVQSRPGVASSIIGARTLDQLTDNLAALDVHLLPEHLHTLDELTRPEMPFPHEFLTRVRSIAQGGTSINGARAEVWPLAPRSDAERH
ncbi:MAG: aldo/keto reductase [Phycisphaerae bacterium]|nr:aldo/keto reductase [Phycisphaerae bacterium]